MNGYLARLLERATPPPVTMPATPLADPFAPPSHAADAIEPPASPTPAIAPPPVLPAPMAPAPIERRPHVRIESGRVRDGSDPVEPTPPPISMPVDALPVAPRAPTPHETVEVRERETVMRELRVSANTVRVEAAAPRPAESIPPHDGPDPLVIADAFMSKLLARSVAAPPARIDRAQPPRADIRDLTPPAAIIPPPPIEPAPRRVEPPTAPERYVESIDPGLTIGAVTIEVAPPVAPPAPPRTAVRNVLVGGSRGFRSVFRSAGSAGLGQL